MAELEREMDTGTPLAQIPVVVAGPLPGRVEHLRGPGATASAVLIDLAVDAVAVEHRHRAQLDHAAAIV